MDRVGIYKRFYKNNREYIQHYQPKKTLVRPLLPKARKILGHPRLCDTYQKGVSQIILNDKQAKSLFDYIDQINDLRSFQGLRHQKSPLIAICICATLCGAKGFAAIFDKASNLTQAMKRRLKVKYKNGNHIIPSKSTIRRFLIAINPYELNHILSAWIQTLKDFDSPIAIDSKTMRGTSKKTEQTLVLGAGDHDSGIHSKALGQTPFSSEHGDLKDSDKSPIISACSEIE